MTHDADVISSDNSDVTQVLSFTKFVETWQESANPGRPKTDVAKINTKKLESATPVQTDANKHIKL